jgi:hypothetical protein
MKSLFLKHLDESEIDDALPNIRVLAASKYLVEQNISYQKEDWHTSDL